LNLGAFLCQVMMHFNLILQKVVETGEKETWN